MATSDQSIPSPAEIAHRFARRDNVAAQIPISKGVLFTYVDNSNVWIEGQRLQAVKEGIARDPYDATNRNVTARWSYDFGRLYQLICPQGARVGRSILLGSKPPPNDSVWRRAHEEGFEVEVFERNVANKEKQVDSSLVTKMLEDSYEYMKSDREDMAVLVAGDKDYLPNMRSLQRRDLRVRVMFWKHATSHELRDTANEFIQLDPYFDWLTHPSGHSDAASST